MEVLPKCINRNRAVQICVSDECIQPNPFICANCVNNQCMQLHRNCINPGWANIKNRIQQSKKLNHPDFIKLSSVVEYTIQKSIKYLQKQLQNFNVWKSTFGMPTDAVNLFKSIQNNQEHKFTGKQVTQILKDAKKEKQIKRYNESTIKQQMKKVLQEMQNTEKMIREMYSVWDVPEEKVQQVKASKIQKVVILEKIVPKLSLKIKQYWLDNMNKRLTNLNEKPTDLELKWLMRLPQFAQSLKNPNLKSLKTLTLYMPYSLGYDSDDINYEQLISSSLLSLPKLQSVTIIANDIKSLDGFKSLGNKLNASKDQGWRDRQQW